jgi:UDP-N-acetylglucosamine--N-acetylmuramyl-(pentapeptide) pyrophosphoryl-undecaprenol N-acetylglucosamine transferase
LKVIGFTDKVYAYSGAADVVVTRAGATNLAEFAVQNKACIIVPGTHLTSGHQVENAKILADKNAAILLSGEDLRTNSNKLAIAINNLLKDSKKQKELQNNIMEFSKPDAAKQIASKLIEISKDEA